MAASVSTWRQQVPPAMRDLDAVYFRRKELARVLGMTPRALLAAAHRRPELAPTHALRQGDRVVHLYSAERAEAVRAYFERGGDGRGRPRIWTLTESAKRERERDRARYYERRARTLRQAGRMAEAERAHQRAVYIRSTLSVQLRKRQDRLLNEPEQLSRVSRATDGDKQNAVLTLTSMTSADQARMPDVELEYRLTLRVLAVICERLLAATGGQLIEVGDAAVRDSPDLIALRDEPGNRILISVER